MLRNQAYAKEFRDLGIMEVDKEQGKLERRNMIIFSFKKK